MLGVDIGAAQIRAAAMEWHRGRWTERARCQENIEVDARPAALAHALLRCVRQTLHCLPRRQRQIVLCIRAAEIMTHSLAVPECFDDDDCQTLVETEASQWFSARMSDLYVDHVVTAAGQGRQLQVFACRRTLVGEVEQTLAAAGLLVQVLDIEAAALLRRAVTPDQTHLHKLTKDSLVLLDIASTGMSLHVFREGSLVFSRCFPFAALVQSESPVLAGQLALELRRALQVLGGTVSLRAQQCLFVSGDLASLSGLEAVFQAYGFCWHTTGSPEFALAQGAGMRRSVLGTWQQATKFRWEHRSC
jgi:Tfp pilus assembly PilM family ATPase